MSDMIGGVWDFCFGCSCMGKLEDKAFEGGADRAAAILGVKGVMDGQGGGTRFHVPKGRTNGLTQETSYPKL